MAPTRFLIKFPTRNRIQKFKNTFEKYQNYFSKTNSLKFLVSIDDDDKVMNSKSTLEYLKSFDNVIIDCGTSTGKIDAVNRGMHLIPKNSFDILMLASDDMVPMVPKYDIIIDSHYKEYYPDYDGVMHYNDGRLGSKLNTFCVMGRKYYERFNYIYNPRYKSVFADNEFTAVSRILDKTTYIPLIMFRHAWLDTVGPDELYVRNENPELYKYDEGVFRARIEEKFDLEDVIKRRGISLTLEVPKR